MRKSKIIVLSLIVICVLWFATFAVYFLLLKDNFAEPRNEETEAAVLQAAGFVKNGPADAQTVRTLYQTRIVTRRLNLDSGQLLPAGSAAAGETRHQGWRKPAELQAVFTRLAQQ